MSTFPTSPLQKKLRVAFFGTPEFAATCLGTLCDSAHEIVGVVTAPDRKAGRGQKIQASAVKHVAMDKRLPILQPTNLKAPEFNAKLSEWKADVFIVVAFRMLPEVVWNAPLYGTINLHASLLPQLRGAAPIQWALIHGLSESGVTTFSLQHAIDTGDILLQKHVAIPSGHDAGQLYGDLLQVGKHLIVETLDRLVAGQLTQQPQREIVTTGNWLEAPKLNRENTSIDWSQSAENVTNKIRGLHPFPKAWTPSAHGDIKILKSTAVHPTNLSIQKPGTPAVEDGNLLICCADGWVRIDELIPPGKGKMSGKDWLNGLQSQPDPFGAQDA